MFIKILLVESGFCSSLRSIKETEEYLQVFWNLFPNLINYFIWQSLLSCRHFLGQELSWIHWIRRSIFLLNRNIWIPSWIHRSWLSLNLFKCIHILALLFFPVFSHPNLEYLFHIRYEFFYHRFDKIFLHLFV